MKEITLGVLLLLYTQVSSSEQIRDEFYSGKITLNNQETEFQLFVDRENQQVRWSIPSSGMTKLPLKKLKFEATSVEGNLSYFGFEKIGSLTANFDNDLCEGKFTWYGNPVTFKLSKNQLPPAYYTEKEVTFQNGTVTLAATFVFPVGVKQAPAIVLLPGSGPFTRYWASYYAEEFAKAGYASIFFDKRGCGKSTGDWTEASLNDMAQDAIAAVNFLKSRPDITSNKIGLWGISQGGWIISRAVAQSKDVAFAIVNSGGGVSPLEEEQFSYDTELAYYNANESEKVRARKIINQYFNFLKTGAGRTELLDEINLVKAEKWYEALSLERILPTESGRKYWEWVATYNPQEDISKIKIPVLMLFGKHDTDQPTDRAVAEWKKGLALAKNTGYQVKIFEDAGHGIRTGGHGHEAGWPKFSNTYMQTQLDWLSNLK